MATNTFDHKQIENKYKDKWYSNNIYEAVDFSDKPKKYILAELPYPSGKSLHVGHMLRYTVPEIYSRFLRMSGFNVLFPMGWDCFGLPAETFAIKQNSTPQQVIEQATKDYKRSMQDMGYAIDWNREITTSDPEYYKWTQWTFKKLYENGLAIQQEMPVWWCQELGVLADEEVLTDSNGNKVSERGGYKVERKNFKQWVLDIPKYADRLIKDLDKTSYKNNVKQGQINWIGKKTGALVNFDILLDNKKLTLTAFTTRPDTLFGVTFLAIAPEHEMVQKIINYSTNPQELNEYIENAKTLSDLEKQTKQKTGTLIKGVFAIHPFTKKQIPIYIADYILLDYGTGVVMGVPAHDQRDFDFAKNYNINIVPVVSKNKNEQPQNLPYEDDGFSINSDEFNGLKTNEAKKLILQKLIDTNIGKQSVTYKLRPQVFSRQRYWGEPIPFYYDKNDNLYTLEDSELPLQLPIMKDFLPSQDGTSPLKRNTMWSHFKDENGNTYYRETDTMPTWAGSNWYYIRYIDPKNKNQLADPEKLKYWMPVDMYFGDAGHTTAHLLYSRFWYKFLYDIGAVPTDEPYDFRMSGGMLLGPDGQKMSKSKGNIVNPSETINEYGADAVRTYLAFIGPYEDTYPWNPRGLHACYKLTKSIYSLYSKVGVQNPDSKDIQEQLKVINVAIKNITSMINDFKLNTAVSEIMILVNALKKQQNIDIEVYKKLVLLISPFMPFLAEELWQKINNYPNWTKENTVHLQKWPEYNEKYTNETNVTVAIQINGKTKSTLDIDINLSQDEVFELVLNQPKIADLLKDKVIKKQIYVKGKVINVVV